MSRSKRRVGAEQLALIGAIGLNAIGSATAADLFYNRQRVNTQCCIPGHNYQHNSFPFTTPDTHRNSAIAVAATDPTLPQRGFRPFHFREGSLTVGPLTLDRVGLALQRDGLPLLATGSIRHNGGDGGLIGSNVVVKMRAFVSHNAMLNDRNLSATSPATPPAAAVATARTASPNEVTSLPIDAVMVWQGEHTFWLSRNGEQMVELRAAPMSGDAVLKLANYFDLITHLEVELGHRRDR
ncbi:hypothetical protein Mal15_44140 [Stieleria maiorica]|uniref:Uncharacterized protein n=1 Tax=Stieleria maiorica TaxID=2795974 RepID=A0A5B9MHG5_9BACT|nr:hypothetical protein [Stieleria maiorica]QEG00344.1 hypothetical protein Mal15_44140 [Stieleria maiorica]